LTQFLHRGQRIGKYFPYISEDQYENEFKADKEKLNHAINSIQGLIENSLYGITKPPKNN
jgi:hypothetical protein